MTFGIRLLAINPNTSVTVTARFLTEARRSLPNTATLDGATGRFGAGIVSSLAENVIAAHAALELLARHGGGYDAVILAISFDTALEAARDLMPVPVIGMTEAAIIAARAHGEVGVITFGSVSMPLYAERLALYGVPADRMETVEVEDTSGYLSGNLDDAVVAAALHLAERGMQAVVVCGAAVVGIARRLQPRLPMPILDGAAPAVAAALRLTKTAIAPRSIRPLGAAQDIDADLAALIAGGKPASRPLPQLVSDRA